jgi:hypothetical protein
MPGSGESWEDICYAVVIVRLRWIGALDLRYKRQKLTDAAESFGQPARHPQLGAH